MTSTATRIRVLALVLGAAVAAWPAGAADAPAAGRATLPPEKLDDLPPAAGVDTGLRSEGLRIPFGSYVSIQVNVDALGQNIVGDAANEPSIAVNPTNGANMAIGWRQFDTITNNFRQAGRAWTMDGGNTWTFPGKLTPGIFRSDPVLDTDSAGNFYYQSLQSDFSMDVFKSTDGGVTFGPPVASFGGDKNWMVIDKSGSIGDGHIYGIWREAFGCCGPNVFTRSVNAGASYQNPVPVPRGPALGTMAVGPNGEVYATGVDELGTGENVAVRSLNARNSAQSPTFSDETINLGGDLVFGGPPNPGGLLGQANVAVDHSLGATRGNVYVLSTVDPLPSQGTQPTAVHVIRSEDDGNTWSLPVRVNDDPGNNGAWHWMAAHSVAPSGRIDVVWNDTRTTGQAAMSALFYAYSYTAGQTWSTNVAVTPPFNSTVGWPNQNKIGDYYTIVSDASGADVAFSATFNGEQDVYYVRVFPDCNSNGTSDVDDVAGGSPDCNGNSVPDSCESTTGCGAAGRVPDGSDEDDVPLLLAKTGSAAIALSWGASCKVSDSDYGIYEGPIGGTFTSHASKLCSTDGETTAEIVPALGSRYFLVVPQSIQSEGSYGKTSAGAQRPQGANACLPRLIGSCLISGGG
jgi:hypothetical protein